MVQFQSARDRLSNHCLFLGGGFHIRKVSFGFSPDFDVSTPHRHLPFFTPHCSRWEPHNLCRIFFVSPGQPNGVIEYVP